MHPFLLLMLTACPGTPKDDTSGTSVVRHHPDGYALPETHGVAAKYQAEACVECHGSDLAGGTSAISCDSCHAEGWRTDCVFCHGGTDNATGAPPTDIDNSTSDLSFAEHGAHVEETIHAAFACVQCHLEPADVLATGHLFLGDSTPGLAEVLFTGGLSSAGTYGGAGSCSNLYCHGNGQAGATGSVTTGARSSCTMCHGDDATSRDLSGEHHEHVPRYECDECHGATVSGNDNVTNPANHVNGSVDLVLPEGMERDGGTCSGECHGEVHRDRTWTR